MLYNEHGWPGSGPGPVVSSGWMNKVVGYTLTKMQASKVVAAISVFGFDFNLATGRNTYVTYEMAAELATQHNSEITFDQNTLTPMFSYTDEQGTRMRYGLKTVRVSLQRCGWHGSRASAGWLCGGLAWKTRQCGPVSSPTLLSEG